MAKPLVAVIAGTRPEAVKLAPVVRAIRARARVRVALIATGQHRELLADTLADLGLRADEDLRLMRRGQTLNALLARAVTGLGFIFSRRRPALVIVQGDTTTALAAALAAFHERIPVAHVEAGLRTGDLSSPFPEELNRVAIDAAAALHFAPTREAARNLDKRVPVTGNTAIDSLRWALRRRAPVREPRLRNLLAALRPGEALALVTAHRRESQATAIPAICRALRDLAEAHPRLHIAFPVHPSPAVRAAARLAAHPRVTLLPPLGYGDMATLLSRCRLVLTDSGGLIEEAATLGKPALILRRVTERQEAVKAGVALIAGLDPRRIVRIASRLLEDPAFYRKMARPTAVFGDGKAGERVAEAVEAFLRARR